MNQINAGKPMSCIQTCAVLLPALRRPLEQVPFFTPHPLRLPKMLPGEEPLNPYKEAFMKKLLPAIAVAVFITHTPICFASYVIHLKEG